ncbi:MAG TPA: recombinase family protein [Candidatus Cloacimonadota bacterium]|nr:recombinase family protein [Candidatus Cloacimonadota bacterium]
MTTYAIGYARVSSKVQNITLNEQKEKIKHFADEQGYELLSCCFSEGSANETLTNKSFIDLIKIIINHFELIEPIRYLLVSDISRLSRNVEEFKSIKSLLDLYGVTIIAIDNPLASYLNQLVLVQKGQEERETNNKKTKMGIARKREEGLHHGKIPYGYERKEGKLEIFQEEADRVKKMYNLIINNKSYKDISKEIPGFSHKNISERVRNPFYCGLIRSNDGHEYQGQHQPIISQEDFDKAKAIIACKTKDKYRSNIVTIKLLEDVVYCPECNKKLLIKTMNGNAMYFYCENSNHLQGRKKNIIDLFTALAKSIYGLHEIDQKIEEYCENIGRVFRRLIYEKTLEKIDTINVHVLGRLFTKKYGHKIRDLFLSLHKGHQENKSRQERLINEVRILINSTVVLKESLWEGLSGLTGKSQKVELIKKQFSEHLYYNGKTLVPMRGKEGESASSSVKLIEVGSHKPIRLYDVFMKEYAKEYDLNAFKLGYVKAYYDVMNEKLKEKVLAKLIKNMKR